MALTNAEKQARYRARQRTLLENSVDMAERALLLDVARADQLSTEQRGALAERLADLAMHYLRRGQGLSAIARRLRPPGWLPPGQ